MASNFDRRRINGPEESYSPVYEEEEATEWDRWKAGNPRPGRSSGDIRPICAYEPLRILGSIEALFVFAVLQPGLINQANGSAYIETERTKIACAVFVLSFRKTPGYSIDFSAQDMVLDNPKILHTVKKAD